MLVMIIAFAKFNILYLQRFMLTSFARSIIPNIIIAKGENKIIVLR